MVRFLVALIVLLNSNLSTAGFYTGNELYTFCTAPKTDQVYYQKRAECRGYLTGVYDLYEYLDFISEKKSLRSSTGITMGQIEKVFIRYAENNPDQLHLPSAHLVFTSLKEAFGCK